MLRYKRSLPSRTCVLGLRSLVRRFSREGSRPQKDLPPTRRTKSRNGGLSSRHQTSRGSDPWAGHSVKFSSANTPRVGNRVNKEFLTETHGPILRGQGPSACPLRAASALSSGVDPEPLREGREAFCR